MAIIRTGGLNLCNTPSAHTVSGHQDQQFHSCSNAEAWDFDDRKSYWLACHFCYCFLDNSPFQFFPLWLYIFPPLILHNTEKWGYCFFVPVPLLKKIKHYFKSIFLRAVVLKCPHLRNHSPIKCDARSNDTFLDMTGLEMSKCSRKRDFNERFVTLFSDTD